jgi:formate dehydrogenase subunit delta
MNTDHLIIMANDIGSFFAAYPDAEQAKRGIANHLKNFWNPIMLKALIKHIENGGEGLSALVSEAVSSNRQLLA